MKVGGWWPTGRTVVLIHRENAKKVAGSLIDGAVAVVGDGVILDGFVVLFERLFYGSNSGG